MPWADVNGVSLHYRLQEGGPPLVLLHEMGGCAESWQFVTPLLTGWHILRPDMRGAGLSEKAAGALSLDALVADLAALLDRVGMRGPVTLAGCAVGAAVALAFAARHPGRSHGVLAMSPATGIPAERRAATLALADGIEAGGLRARVLERLDHAFPERYRTDPARLDAYRGVMLANDPASYAATYRMLAGMDLSADLPRIACPCLVLGGETDGTRPPAVVAQVAASIPGARFRAVPSGHVMPLLTPELVAAAITELGEQKSTMGTANLV